MVRYYHGTTWGVVDKGSLINPYLTDSFERALYYAEETAETEGGEPVVVEVLDVDITGLRYDGAAMDEPVMASEEDRDQAWSSAAQEHPDWVQGGSIWVPSTAWDVSWRGVGSARYEGKCTSLVVRDE